LTDSTLDIIDISYAQRVGSRLRIIRRQKGLSLQDVEASSGHEFKASVLGAYERGERAISVPRLYRLARFYGVPVDRLLPGDMSAEPPDGDHYEINLADGEREARSHRNGDDAVTIDLTRAQHMDEPEIDLLNRYLGMIQLQRQDFNGRMLTIRRDDMRAIACLFQTTQDALRRRLDDLGLRISI
jgi:transcriptional regulator with XRE-family HTH domain